MKIEDPPHYLAPLKQTSCYSSDPVYLFTRSGFPSQIHSPKTSISSFQKNHSDEKQNPAIFNKNNYIPTRFIGSLGNDSVMGRKGSWFSSIKKTLSPSSKEKKSQKSEKKGVVEENPSAVDTPIIENVGGSSDSHQPEEVKPIEVEAEPPKTAYAAAVAASSSTPKATNTTSYPGKSRVEVAAVRIQTAFRGYLAKRVLWGLRGLVRLKIVVEGPSVKRQTINMLKYTQNASHVQSQINSRRIRMSEANQALRKQLLQKRINVLNQNEDEWNDSVQSREEMEAKLLSKYEATMRRERAMAYSFSHQQPWKKSTGTPNLLFMDPTNPQWGWSWSERYIASRPCEKDPGDNHSSVKRGITVTTNEIAKSYARRQLNSTPTTPRSKPGGSLASKRPKPGLSPRALNLDNDQDDDSQSVASVRSEKNRRHSVAGSTAKPKSAKAKSRGLGLPENGGGGAKKPLSFPGSPARPRRHSVPPKVESSICDGLE